MESYDAAALIILAMQAAGSTDPAVYKDKILEVANGPADGSGTKILPGEIGKALELIAAGTANHAGAGSWQGLVGNSSVFGIEAEHPGATGIPWSADQLDAYIRLSAELCKRGGFSSALVAGHKEWAPGRKVDPIDLDMDDMRRRIALAMEDEMEPVPQPSWLPDDVIDRLMAAKVIVTRPTLEPLVIWRMFVFQDRTLTAAAAAGGGTGSVPPHTHTATVQTVVAVS
jgi:hypothetical protein